MSGKLALQGLEPQTGHLSVVLVVSVSVIADIGTMYQTGRKALHGAPDEHCFKLHKDRHRVSPTGV